MFMRKTKSKDAAMNALLGADGEKLTAHAASFEVTTKQLSTLHSTYFMAVIESYLTGGDEWRHIAPGESRHHTHRTIHFTNRY
jgi:hypothetical protein